MKATHGERIVSGSHLQKQRLIIDRLALPHTLHDWLRIRNNMLSK